MTFLVSPNISIINNTELGKRSWPGGSRLFKVTRGKFEFSDQGEFYNMANIKTRRNTFKMTVVISKRMILSVI